MSTSNSRCIALTPNLPDIRSHKLISSRYLLFSQRPREPRRLDKARCTAAFAMCCHNCPYFAFQERFRYDTFRERQTHRLPYRAFGILYVK